MLPGSAAVRVRRDATQSSVFARFQQLNTPGDPSVRNVRNKTPVRITHRFTLVFWRCGRTMRPGLTARRSQRVRESFRRIWRRRTNGVSASLATRRDRALSIPGCGPRRIARGMVRIRAPSYAGHGAGGSSSSAGSKKRPTGSSANLLPAGLASWRGRATRRARRPNKTDYRAYLFIVSTQHASRWVTPVRPSHSDVASQRRSAFHPVNYRACGASRIRDASFCHGAGRSVRAPAQSAAPEWTKCA